MAEQIRGNVWEEACGTRRLGEAELSQGIVQVWDSEDAERFQQLLASKTEKITCHEHETRAMGTSRSLPWNQFSCLSSGYGTCLPVPLEPCQIK